MNYKYIILPILLAVFFTVNIYASSDEVVSDTEITSISNDGVFIVIKNNASLVVVNTIEKKIVFIFNEKNFSPRSASISSDNKNLLVDMTNSLWVLNLETSEKNEIRTFGGLGGYYPEFSSDSNYISYLPSNSLIIYNTNTKKIIKHISGYIKKSAWNKKENKIIYSKCLEQSSKCDLYIYDVNTDDNFQVTYDGLAGFPIFYDNESILFYEDTFPYGDVFKISAVGGSKQFVINNRPSLFDKSSNLFLESFFNGKNIVINSLSLGKNTKNTITQLQPTKAIDDKIKIIKNIKVNINAVSNDTSINKSPLKITNYDPVSKNNGKITKEENNTLEYTPPIDFIGVDTFEYTIEDGNKITSTATVTITVKDKNHDPIAIKDMVSTEQDTAITIPDIIANDTDPDNNPLTITLFDKTSKQGGKVKKGDNGLFTYTPKSKFLGEDSFTYIISDGKGGTAVGTVIITVTPIPNKPPVATNDVISLTVSTSKVIDVLANDSDPEGEILIITKFDVKSKQGGKISKNTRNTDSTLTYTPKVDYIGSDSFSYTVSDGNSTTVGTVTITVTPIANKSPIAKNDEVTTPSDTPKIIDVLVNDTDPDGDKLTISKFDTKSTQGGKIAKNDDGTLTYISKIGYTGLDSFTYTISDNKGGTSTATVNITVEDCFIATAAFGSYLHADVKVLRDFRDNYLLTNSLGKSFVNFYYKNSPPIAGYIAERDTLKMVVRSVLTPIVYIMKYPFLLLLFVVSLVLWRKRKTIFLRSQLSV